MIDTLPQPWLEEDLEHLDLRRDDRCLLLSCPTPAHVAAVSQAVGRDARIVVVERRRARAEAAAELPHPALEVVHLDDAAGDEHFGTFDALLACPLTTLGWGLPVWTGLTRNNLRPGGRFVLDLPAETFCPTLRQACEQLDLPAEILARFCGPDEAELAAALRAAGMRNVEAAVGTHLLKLDSPLDLMRALRATGAEAPWDDLGRVLIEMLRSNREVEVLCHRSRVHGQR